MHHMPRAGDRLEDMRQRFVVARLIRLAQRPLGLHLERRQRRTQLVGGIGDEAALRQLCIGKLADQPVGGIEQRSQFVRRMFQFRDRLELVGLVARQARSNVLDRAQAGGDGKPHQQTGDHQNHRLHRQENQHDVAQQRIPLDPRLGHLNDHLVVTGAAFPVQQGNHPRLPAIHLRIVKLRFPWNQLLREFRETRIAEQEPGLERRDLAEHAVDTIPFEHFDSRPRKLQDQSPILDLDLLGQRHRRIVQPVIVNDGTDVPRQRQCRHSAQDQHDEQRPPQPDQQALPQAVTRIPSHDPPAPDGSPTRAKRAHERRRPLRRACAADG